MPSAVVGVGLHKNKPLLTKRIVRKLLLFRQLKTPVSNLPFPTYVRKTRYVESNTPAVILSARYASGCAKAFAIAST